MFDNQWSKRSERSIQIVELFFSGRWNRRRTVSNLGLPSAVSSDWNWIEFWLPVRNCRQNWNPNRNRIQKRTHPLIRRPRCCCWHGCGSFCCCHGAEAEPAPLPPPLSLLLPLPPLLLLLPPPLQPLLLLLLPDEGPDVEEMWSAEWGKERAWWVDPLGG